MSLPITPLIDLAISLIAIYCSINLYRSYKKDENHVVLLYFSQAYFVVIFSYLFFSLPRLIFPENAHIIGVGFLIAQALLYLTTALFAKVTAYFFKVIWAKRVFWIILLLSIVAIVINIIFFTLPNYNEFTGLTDWNIEPIVGISSIFILAGVLIPSSIFFFWQGFKSQDKIVKKRSIIISIGIFSLVITALIYYSATTITVALISDLLSLMSFLIVFFGVIYKRDNEYNHNHKI